MVLMRLERYVGLGLLAAGVAVASLAAAPATAFAQDAAAVHDVPATPTAQAAPPSTDLPRVTVTAPYTTAHGGYVISSDFRVDPRMPTVVFPAQALVKDDILSIKPVHLNDDEYLVLQECAVADCSQASLVRVWNSLGATGSVRLSESRIWIQHENKYFIWMRKLPEIALNACGTCGTHFTQFDGLSPPMTLYPTGELARQFRNGLADVADAEPIPVESQSHEGSEFVIRFKGGSVVRIKRMHAVAGSESPAPPAGP
jgi:hypothetical protein